MANKEKDMPGFMTYKEAALMFTLMGEHDAAQAIQAACNYYLYGSEPELDGIVARVFEIEKAAIDRGRSEYKAKVDGGRKGGNRHWHGKEGNL